MGGWVVDNIGIFGNGQDDAFDGRMAIGTAAIDNPGNRFGSGQTPATAIFDMLQNHSRAQVVFSDQTEDALSTIHVPTAEVFDQAPEWLDEHFGDADDVEAYMGFDGHGYAIYANWTLDAGGHCNRGGDSCAAPMIVRLPVGSQAHAFFQLGWAIHFLEDVTTPVHTINGSLETFEIHNDIEQRANEVLANPGVAYGGHYVKD